MKGTIARLLIIVGAALSFATPRGAAAQGSSLSDWKLRALLYGWLPTTVPGASSYWSSGPVGAQAEASDSLDDADFDAPASRPERPRTRWGLNADFLYLDTGAGIGAARSLSAIDPLALALPADAYAGAHPRLRGWSWSLLGSYALVDRPSHQVQLLGGTRYLRVESGADPRFSGSLAGFPAFAASGASMTKADVWDAVVGAKGRYRFGEQGRWFLPYYFDVGAGQSDFTWQAMGGIGYRFGWGELFASYRHLDYRFDARYLKDLSFSGPGVGLSFRW